MPLRGRFSPAQEDPLRQELKKDATNGTFRTFDVTTLSFVDTYKGGTSLEPKAPMDNLP